MGQWWRKARLSPKSVKIIIIFLFDGWRCTQYSFPKVILPLERFIAPFAALVFFLPLRSLLNGVLYYDAGDAVCRALCAVWLCMHESVPPPRFALNNRILTISNRWAVSTFVAAQSMWQAKPLANRKTPSSFHFVQMQRLLWIDAVIVAAVSVDQNHFFVISYNAIGGTWWGPSRDVIRAGCLHYSICTYTFADANLH